MHSIEREVYDLLQREKTKASKKAFDVLDRNGLGGIVTNGDVFWFESYSRGNDCPKYIYEYLTKFITRKFNLRYAFTEV